MKLEIRVLAWDKHKGVTGLNWLIETQLSTHSYFQ